MIVGRPPTTSMPPWLAPAFAAAVLATWVLIPMQLPDQALILPLPVLTWAGILYVAGSAAIASAAWHSPHGQFNLRSAAIAALASAGVIFAILHLMFQVGQPPISGSAATNAAAYLSLISQVWLPVVLLLLNIPHLRQPIANALRWGLQVLAVGLALALSVFILNHAAELPPLHTTDASILAALAPALIIGLDTLVVVQIVRRGKPWQLADLSILAAAALSATGQSLSINALDDHSLLLLLAHISNVVALVAAFSAVYAEAVAQPFKALERAHIASERERLRIENVLGAIVEGVVVVDSKLNVEMMNPVACHLLGCRSGSLCGTPLAPALENTDSSAIKDILDALTVALESGRSRHSHVPVVWHIADHQTAVEYSASPIRAAGRTTGAVLTLRDVTERSSLLDALNEGTEYARTLIEASPDPIIVTDSTGIIADVNFASERISGIPRADLIGTPFSHLFDDRARVEGALQTQLPHATVRDLSLVLTASSGARAEVSCSIAPLRDGDGRSTGAIAVARDVSELRQVQLALEFQATCDPLTALPNRRMFRERIAAAVAHAANARIIGAVLIVDLDNFKDVNDALGHSVGDDLIKSVGHSLRGCLRETDFVARIGGDEFGVLVADCTNDPYLAILMDKIRLSIAAPHMVENGEITVTCSIGAAVFPSSSSDAATLLRNADTAMYRAKASGRNGCQVFTDDMNAAVQRRVLLGNRLRNALDRAEFSLHYQPQLDITSGTVVGAEALLRWYPAGLEDISPAEFIPIAEDSGLILAIGDWVLNEACRQAAEWRSSLGVDIRVAVNLSARQFRETDLLARIERALGNSGLPPHLLDLELTESTLVSEPQRVAKILAALKATGIRISIDDFGTGYSSLSYLKRFPLDFLKIDRSFIRDLPSTEDDIAIVRSIIALAKDLRLGVIAEGIETPHQLEIVASLGCTEIQGFLVSRPLPAIALQDYLDRHRNRHAVLTTSTLTTDHADLDFADLCD